MGDLAVVLIYLGTKNDFWELLKDLRDYKNDKEGEGSDFCVKRIAC